MSEEIPIPTSLVIAMLVIFVIFFILVAILQYGTNIHRATQEYYYGQMVFTLGILIFFIFALWAAWYSWIWLSLIFFICLITTVWWMMDGSQQKFEARTKSHYSKMLAT